MTAASSRSIKSPSWGATRWLCCSASFSQTIAAVARTALALGSQIFCASAVHSAADFLRFAVRFTRIYAPNALSRDLFEAGLGGGFNCYQPGQHIFASGVSLLPHRKVDATPAWRRLRATGMRCHRSESARLPKLKARSLSRPGPPWMDQVLRPDSSSEVLYCDHYPRRTTLYWRAPQVRALGRPAKLSSAYGHARSMTAIHCRAFVRQLTETPLAGAPLLYQEIHVPYRAGERTWIRQPTSRRRHHKIG